MPSSLFHFSFQSAKAFVKKSFKKVPIIGWTAFFSENAFLERYTVFKFLLLFVNILLLTSLNSVEAGKKTSQH